jgi:hypothetical protein
MKKIKKKRKNGKEDRRGGIWDSRTDRTDFFEKVVEIIYNRNSFSKFPKNLSHRLFLSQKN